MEDCMAWMEDFLRIPEDRSKVANHLQYGNLNLAHMDLVHTYHLQELKQNSNNQRIKHYKLRHKLLQTVFIGVLDIVS